MREGESESESESERKYQRVEKSTGVREKGIDGGRSDEVVWYFKHRIVRKQM